MTGYLIITLLLVVHKMYQWKNFEKWLIFGKDIDNQKVGRFLGQCIHHCRLLYGARLNPTENSESSTVQAERGLFCKCFIVARPMSVSQLYRNCVYSYVLLETWIAGWTRECSTRASATATRHIRRRVLYAALSGSTSHRVYSIHI